MFILIRSKYQILIIKIEKITLLNILIILIIYLRKNESIFTLNFTFQGNNVNTVSDSLLPPPWNLNFFGIFERGG